MSKGLYANIHAKRKRIKRQKAEGKTPERMRKAGSKGAPTAKAFRESAKSAKKPTFEWGDVMPMVDGKKYPYTKEGKAAAAKAAKKKPKKKAKAKGAMYE